MCEPDGGDGERRAERAEYWRDRIRRLDRCVDAASRLELPRGEDHYVRLMRQFYRNSSIYKERCDANMETIKNLLAKLEVHRFPNKCTDNLRAEALSTASQSAAWLASLVDDLLDRGNKALEAHRTGTKRGPKCPATEVGPMGQAGGQLGNVSLAPQWVEGGRANKRQRPGSLWGSDKKPQKGFAIPVDNSNEPYKPRLDHLAGLLTGYPPETFDNSQPDALLAKIGIRDCQGLYPHPFQAELNALKYIPSQLAKGTCREPEAIESTPFLYVDSQEGLEKLVEHLHGQEEVAVDLEANLFRSFQGLTCLLQMSTRTRDFIVDTLAVKDEIGPALAPMFADPQVVKVMHGGGNDILWLQHDLGIYVVNLFDTHQACKVGGHLRGGLAYLLEQYCSIKADKRLQLADWRIRPLSKEMLHYAQCDTHYLLYIYDKLRHQLIDQGEEVPEKFQVDLRDGSPTGALGTVLERSRILCLQRYEKPLLNEFSYLSILKREAEGLNEVQEMVAAALYAWRDATARDLDESAGFVLSKKVLVKLAVALPDNVKQVQKHLKKGSQGFGDAIFNVITNARQRFMLGRLQAASPGTPGALASVSLDLPPAAPATTLEPKPVCIKAASGQSAFQRMLGATNLTATDGSDVKMHIAEPSLCESAIQTADIDMNANLSLMGVDAVADSHCPCSADVTTASQLPSNAGGLKDGMEDVQQLAGCGPATGLRAREVKPIVLQGRPCSMQGDIEDKGLTAAEMIKASFSLPFMVATNVGNDGDVEGQGEEGGRVGNGMDVDLGESVEPTETAIAEIRGVVDGMATAATSKCLSVNGDSEGQDGSQYDGDGANEGQGTSAGDGLPKSLREVYKLSKRRTPGSHQVPERLPKGGRQGEGLQHVFQAVGLEAPADLEPDDGAAALPAQPAPKAVQKAPQITPAQVVPFDYGAAPPLGSEPQKQGQRGVPGGAGRDRGRKRGRGEEADAMKRGMDRRGCTVRPLSGNRSMTFK